MDKKETAAPVVAKAATATAAPKAAASKAAAEGSYTVASPIKHDGEDYEEGDTIRLPEATAHRLAGYLKA